jgi:hypothetical protein
VTEGPAIEWDAVGIERGKLEINGRKERDKV